MVEITIFTVVCSKTSSVLNYFYSHMYSLSSKFFIQIKKNIKEERSMAVNLSGFIHSRVFFYKILIRLFFKRSYLLLEYSEVKESDPVSLRILCIDVGGRPYIPKVYLLNSPFSMLYRQLVKYIQL